MVISRTPFRLSLFGGGTDYPVWFRDHGGAVLASTINKYCYISCRHLPPFFEHKYRIAYSSIEEVKDLSEIRHPSANKVLQFIGAEQGMEIHYDGDLPARTGLGSSSSFTVGLLNALYALQGKVTTKMKLALDAIHVEQNMIKENVGSQDQVSAAFGGFNRITFYPNDEISVDPVTVSQKRLAELEAHLMLFYTGVSRFASEIAADQIQNTCHKKDELQTIYRMVDEAIAILSNGADIKDIGKLLHESWQLKKNLSCKISNCHIDDIYKAGRRAGAIGGKLTGAGGGGFILFFADPENQPKIKKALRDLLHVPFKFENLGSQIIFYQPNGYHHS